MDDRISTPGQEGRVLITPENGSPYYATIQMADNPLQEGTPLNKANLLQDYTCDILKIPRTSVPNDAFVALAVGSNKYSYAVTVKTPGGRPLPNANITNLTLPNGEPAVTDENGYVLGVSPERTITLYITHNYSDIVSPITKSVTATDTITEVTATGTRSPSNGVYTETSKQVFLSSDVGTINGSVCGAGGGGGTSSVLYYPDSGNTIDAHGGGGAAGDVNNVSGVNVTPTTAFNTVDLIVGHGGEAGAKPEDIDIPDSGGRIRETGNSGYQGGNSSIALNGVVIASASGGNPGGPGSVPLSSSTGSAQGGVGGQGNNGNGGTGGSNNPNQTSSPATDGTKSMLYPTEKATGGGGGGGGGEADQETSLGGSPCGGNGGAINISGFPVEVVTIEASDGLTPGGGGGGALSRYGGGTWVFYNAGKGGNGAAGISWTYREDVVA